MLKCVLCGHVVGQGDRHAKRNCPPPASGRKFALKRAARAKAKRAAEWVPQRGQAVKGTGVPKGATK